MIKNVNYRQVERKRKLPKVPKFVKSEINRLNAENLKRGLVVYEVVMLHSDEYSDSYTEIEADLDRELADVVSTPSPADIRISLRKIITTNGADGRSKLVQRCDAENPEEELGKMSFEFPADINPNYGFNREIEDALISYEENEFHDRLDRIRCKQELLKFLKYNESPSHRVTRAIVEDDDKYRVQGVRDVLGLDSDEGGEEEWWTADDLTLDDLESREHTEDGDGLTAKQKPERIEALQTALENDRTVSSEAEVAEKVEEVYPVKSDSTIQSYVEKIDLHWVDTIVANHTRPLESTQEKLLERASHGSKQKFRGDLSELFCVPSELLESGEMRVERAFVLADELQHRIDLKHDIGAKNQILNDIRESLENQKELCRKVADEWDEDVVGEFRAELRGETDGDSEANKEQSIEEEVESAMEKF